MEPEKEVTTDVSERIKGLESEINEKTLALSEAGARIAGMETESKAQNEEITVLKKY